MLNNESKDDQLILSEETLTKAFSRRNFFGIMGLGTAAIMTAAACKKNDIVPVDLDGVDLGSGDFGILNYGFGTL